MDDGPSFTTRADQPLRPAPFLLALLFLFKDPGVGTTGAFDMTTTPQKRTFRPDPDRLLAGSTVLAAESRLSAEPSIIAGHSLTFYSTPEAT